MAWLPFILERAQAILVTWGFGFAVMTALELLLPRERQPLRTRLHGLVFWALWLPVMGFIQGGFHALWAWLGIRPLIVLPLDFTWAGAIAVIAAPLAGAAVYDFFFYWCHRAQHALLWRWHAVHHSIRDLNTINAYHHPIEPIVQTVLILLPASLIVSDTGVVPTVMMVLIYLHSSFIHASTRLHLGPLAAVLVDNRYHRIHHSVEERHFDRNFGAFTTIWDRLFGTVWIPARDEWPETGLAEVDQPRSIREWLTLPWRYRRATTPEATGPARPVTA